VSPPTPNNNNNKVIETIDLLTPEKGGKDRENGHEDEVSKDLSEKKPEEIGKKSLFIDLTADTPIKDRSLVETTLNFSFSPTSKTPTNDEPLKDNIPDIISSINSGKKPSSEEERSRSPVHETSIAVPKIPWTLSNPEEIESDSLSETSGSSKSSSTSSVEDIPHFILDSTTSPETQNGERFVPRLEVRDTSGELMQIDSLMIIDGKYVGDPADLKLSEKLPEGTEIPSPNVHVDDKDSIVIVEEVPEEQDEDDDPNKNNNSISENGSEKKLIVSEVSDSSSKKTDCDTSNVTNNVVSPIVSRPYEATFSVRKPPSELKFDTKNENKLETLKNIPFIIEKDKVDVEKPTSLPIAPPNDDKKTEESSDGEKTPMAALAKELDISDSETEATGQNLTETELSDWNADDAVSENFVDIEFALNSNKGG
jgi:hypothetical protein